MGIKARTLGVVLLAGSLGLGGCQKSGARVELSEASQRGEAALAGLANQVADLQSQVKQLERQSGADTNLAIQTHATPAVSSLPANLLNEAPACSSQNPSPALVTSSNERLNEVRARLRSLEARLTDKRTNNSIVSRNMRMLANEMRGHTSLYQLTGQYKVLVIPVQFADVKFAAPEFFEKDAQDYLFGAGEGSLSSYYRHASLGKLQVTGEVVEPVTVDGNLVSYGEAVTGNSDINARELVVQALQKVRASHPDDSWWESFDNWDLNDYDLDNQRYEPDGFIDAVVLITAGKPQSSCQASFDLERSRPPSAEVPPGPRHDAAVECFNRLWPHRWSISLASDDPRYSAQGPELEGTRRSSLNGFKITDHLFALDYNMQSEYSDRATFIHEFGHSLTLPDVYDNAGPGNSSGAWEVMSETTHLQAQEMSSYSKVSLGWVEPKIVKKGQQTSAYLGAYNFVPEEQRNNPQNFAGPEKNDEEVDGEIHRYDVVSLTPGFAEPVYRSVVALMGPTVEERAVVEVPASTGTYAAYSGRFDGASRSLKLKFQVPSSGDQVLHFDEIHHIETETNFESRDPVVRVVTDFDIGSILVNGAVREELRLMSGDANFDSLVEADPNCDAAKVLALRAKRIDGSISEEERGQLDEGVEACHKPAWMHKSVDLSAFAGQEVELEIRYVTDGGYTEFGIIVDNFELGGQKIDFESGDRRQAGEFELLKHGKTEIQTNQFYLFEYRSPNEDFTGPSGSLASYNMDRNIVGSAQAMFQAEGASLQERFRLVTVDYQPGVLVWYFNSKFDRRSNSPLQNGGKGYLLVVNSKVQELKMPGIFASPELFNGNGEYDAEAEGFKNFVAEQGRLLKCFGATAYYTYIDGEAPQCGDVPANQQDSMGALKLGGEILTERRAGINEFLPVDQYKNYLVAMPLRLNSSMRVGQGTFRPLQEGPAHPIRVYKAGANGEMVLDTALTSQAMSLAPVASFRDKDSVLAANPRFRSDTVVVEKKGFGFDVAQPSPRIVKLYRPDASAVENDNIHRRPRAKINFVWE